MSDDRDPWLVPLPPRPYLGTMVIDEQIAPLDEVRLADGRVEFIATYKGPREFHDGHWNIYAPDGALVFRGYSELLDNATMTSLCTWEMTMAANFNGKLGDKARAHLAQK